MRTNDAAMTAMLMRDIVTTAMMSRGESRHVQVDAVLELHRVGEVDGWTAESGSLGSRRPTVYSASMSAVSDEEDEDDDGRAMAKLKFLSDYKEVRTEDLNAMWAVESSTGRETLRQIGRTSGHPTTEQDIFRARG